MFENDRVALIKHKMYDLSVRETALKSDIRRREAALKALYSDLTDIRDTSAMLAEEHEDLTHERANLKPSYQSLTLKESKSTR